MSLRRFDAGECECVEQHSIFFHVRNILSKHGLFLVSCQLLPSDLDILKTGWEGGGGSKELMGLFGTR